MATDVSVGTCPVCREYYEDPRILDCGHSICKPCIDQIYASIRVVPHRNFLKCPICRLVTRLRGKGTEGMKKNYQLEETVQMISASASTSASQSQDTNCEEHGVQVVTYCETCEELICPECMIGKHRQHELMVIEKKYEEVSEDLKATEDIAADVEKRIKEALKSRTAALNNIEAAQRTAEQNVTNCFEEIGKQLKMRNVETRNRLVRKVNWWRRPVLADIHSLQTGLGSLLESKNSFEASQKKGKIHTIMNEQDIRRRLKAASSKARRSLELRPLPTYTTATVCSLQVKTAMSKIHLEFENMQESALSRKCQACDFDVDQMRDENRKNKEENGKLMKELEHVKAELGKTKELEAALRSNIEDLHDIIERKDSEHKRVKRTVLEAFESTPQPECPAQKKQKKDNTYTVAIL